MNRKLKEILSTSLYLLVVLVLTFLVVTYVGQRTQVIGSSMEPMLSDGDNLIVDKISYRFQDPQRFDIIVFPFQYEENTYYIKRIIGLPGETVYIDENGQIFINDVLLKESYGKEVILDSGRAYEPITLGIDEYFVMGDNRNNSSDSRDPAVGNIHRDELIGKAWVRIWPLNKIGMIKHQ
ncbi:MAG: signal peptidase I [Suilimivivens sp.]|nr:signal peptidase I [Lachnospiraceae bacterium]